jgi:ribosome-binding ATPase YchF (GTP1/OBG family)
MLYANMNVCCGVDAKATVHLVFSVQLLTAKEAIFMMNMTSMDYHRRRSNAAVQAVEQFLIGRADPCADVVLFSGEFEDRILQIERTVSDPGSESVVFGGKQGVDEYFAINTTQISLQSLFFPRLCHTLQCLQYYTHGGTDDLDQKDRSSRRRSLRAWIIRDTYVSNMTIHLSVDLSVYRSILS